MNERHGEPSPNARFCREPGGVQSDDGRKSRAY
jgi:hypothetical protein